MRLLILTALVAVFSYPAYAIDNVEPVKKTKANGNCWLWENIESTEVNYITDLGDWAGGQGSILVTGYEGGVSSAETLEITLGYSSGGTYSIDADDAPDGLTFDSATKFGANFNWAGSHIGIDFSSGSLYQDIDVEICEGRDRVRNR